jgi:hypothetical protein
MRSYKCSRWWWAAMSSLVVNHASGWAANSREVLDEVISAASEAESGSWPDYSAGIGS